MAALRIGSKCSHTTVYAPLLSRTAPCPEPLSHIFERGFNAAKALNDQIYD